MHAPVQNEDQSGRVGRGGQGAMQQRCAGPAWTVLSKPRSRF